VASNKNNSLKNVSVVIPVYNNAGSLIELWGELQENYMKFPEVHVETIFVNDGSFDDSQEVLANLIVNSKYKIKVLKLTKNFGQLGAIKAGLLESRGDAVITISADLQDPTEIISDFLSKWLGGSKLVLGLRINRGDSFSRRLTSAVAYSVLRLDNPDIPKGGFDIFLADKEIISKLISMPGRHNFIQGDLLSFGFPFELVPYDRRKRVHGKSAYNFRKRYSLFTQAIYDSSQKPIQFLSSIGICAGILGIILAMYLVSQHFLNKSPFSGFTLLSSSILMMGGIQIMFLSIVSQYLWRIYDLLRVKPAFVIAERLSN
jgi:polyisoprenyl-phosphate glycosyltransferase